MLALVYHASPVPSVGDHVTEAVVNVRLKKFVRPVQVAAVPSSPNILNVNDPAALALEYIFSVAESIVAPSGTNDSARYREDSPHFLAVDGATIVSAIKRNIPYPPVRIAVLFRRIAVIMTAERLQIGN